MMSPISFQSFQPPPKTFAGILGDVERATASFKDMKDHKHNKPQDALPLYRLMTLLDPQFIQGWTTGANVMLWDKSPNGLKHSLEFLQEGLANNPKSIDILTTIAYCYLKERDGIRQFAKAIPYMEQARQIVDENWAHLGEEEKESALVNYRRLAVSLREMGQFEAEKKVVAEGLSRFPGDVALDRFRRQLNGEVISEAEISPPSVIKQDTPVESEDHDDDHDHDHNHDDDHDGDYDGDHEVKHPVRVRFI